MCVVLACAWVASERWYIMRQSPRCFMCVERGTVFINCDLRAVGPSAAVWELGRIDPSDERHWWPTWSIDTVHAYMAVQFWTPALLALGLAGTAWRLDTLAHRRAMLHACRKCGYDRAGLPPHTPCPECGTPQS